MALKGTDTAVVVTQKKVPVRFSLFHELFVFLDGVITEKLSTRIEVDVREKKKAHAKEDLGSELRSGSGAN